MHISDITLRSIIISVKSKAVPLHTMEELGGEEV
jgi:hypothetical protein